MYADDTSLCYQSADMFLLNEVINNDLEHLINKFSLIVAKTNSMCVPTKKMQTIMSSRMEKLNLQIVDNETEIIEKK